MDDAASQALYARRHGTVPGPRVRGSARISERLAGGQCSSSGRACTSIYHAGGGGRRGRIARTSRSVSMMQQRDWYGVFPAITTPFRPDLSIDHDALADHVQWLIDSGCVGIVALGSLGESQALTGAEKIAILKTCRRVLPAGVPLVAGIAGLTTSECVDLSRRSVEVGCDGLMALPVYVYRGDWRETKAHYSAVISATKVTCMLYNNPIAYGTDVTPDQLAELAERHDNLHAVKESSGDVRRVTALRERLGDRIAIFAGMDDMILESVPMGAVGWIAGLVNAFPEESVQLFELAREGRFEE